MEQKFVKYYPGKYSEKDSALIATLTNRYERIRNREPFDVTAFNKGNLHADYPGRKEKFTSITREGMEYIRDLYIPGNRLYSDDNYARVLGYTSMPAFQLILAPDFMDAMPAGIGDYMVVSGHNDYLKFMCPIYEGDTIYAVVDDAGFVDLTPAEGSFYRTFALWGYGRFFNQKGELVALGANILKESFRSHTDPTLRKAWREWESPDWWGTRPAHVYTESDWEFIKKLWREEKVRGEQVLYWDDVQVGVELPCTADGPLVCDFDTDIVFNYPTINNHIKKIILDKRENELVKNRFGAYCTQECLDRNGTPPDDPRPVGVATAHKESDGRNPIQNQVAVKMAMKMLNNWMGYHGKLKAIWWEIMSEIPGYKGIIPDHSWKPPQFDKENYLDYVPYMKGKPAEYHLLENDLCISKAYIVKKYEDTSDAMVDLVWWTETIDGEIVQNGMFQVTLPKR